MAQALALGRQLGLLGRVRGRRLDLRELEAQQVEVALARALALAQLRELARERRDLGVRARGSASRSSSCSGPANPSRISSCAEARVSRRCSCWP